ncbi:MAG: dihydrodipicolinate synthase family protein [Firmicutes bacterium]|nr:dihydrodipicolinate synthase family protein [Bacillota bacterium]
MKNAVITALATPFVNDGIDVESYIKLVTYQKRSGVDALLALGTTAEAQLLTRGEKKLLLTIAKEISAELPLIAGVEESATKKAVYESVFAEKLGANALLIAPPSFCKCTEEGYRLHVEQIAESVNIPLILYNVPSRVGYGLSVTAVKSLANKIVGVKDAADDTAFAEKISDGINVLCGNELKLRDYLTRGAKGVISVVSNAAPRLTREAVSGKTSGIFDGLAKLSMLETNPIAIKYMLYKQRIFATCDARLPLTAASKRTRNAIDVFFEKNRDVIR